MTAKKPRRATAASVIGMEHPLVGKPQFVPFGTLQVAPERFQVRNPKAASFVQGVLKEQESRALSASLVEVIDAGALLDPVIVWEDPEGARWVIDGHHRMEAFGAADASPEKVWIQRLQVKTEAEARRFALEINKRAHLNMAPAEVRDDYWRTLLCGEDIGSVRGRVQRYGVSQSTVQRMDKEKAAVLANLKQEAEEQEVPLDAAFIRANAPAWKDLATWRKGGEGSPKGDIDRKVVERMLRTLALRFTKDAKARPEALLEAFQEFFEDATGRTLVIEEDAGLEGTPEDEHSDF